jgi:hypothetical protein
MPPKRSKEPPAPKVKPPASYRRGDGYQAPCAALVQKREGEKYVLRERATGLFVNDSKEPFAGVAREP